MKSLQITMPAVNIALSDEMHNHLVEIANLTGITKSSLAAEYVRRGIYEDAKNHKELLQLQNVMHQQSAKTPSTKRHRGEEK